MSAYLARLKQIENKKNSLYIPNSEPSKPSKVPFEPFEGTHPAHIEKNIIDDVAIIAPPKTSWGWLIHYPDRDPVEAYVIPEPSHAEVLRDFPGAIAAEPIPDSPKRRATPAQEAELRVLVAAIYSGDTDADRAEALVAALADPDDALACYRAIVLE